MWYLSLWAGNNQESKVVLKGRDVTIGRGSDNNIMIDDSSVSRRHAVLLWDGIERSWSLVDKNSSNGSYIQDRPIPSRVPHKLAIGESFRIGDVELRLNNGEVAAIEEMPTSQLTERYTNSPTKQINIQLGQRKAKNATRFLVSTLVVIVMYAAVNTYIIRSSAAGQTWKNPVMYLVAVLTIIAFIPLVRWCGFTLRTVGLTLRHWKKSIVESLVFSGVAIALMIGGKIAANRLGIIDEETVFHNVSRHLSTLGICIYAISSFAQELMNRGIVIAGIEETYDGRYGTLTAVVVSSLIFGLIHLFVSLTFFFITLFAGLLFAVIYIRHRTVIGVSLFHFLVGIMFIMIFEPFLL